MNYAPYLPLFDTKIKDIRLFVFNPFYDTQKSDFDVGDILFTTNDVYIIDSKFHSNRRILYNLKQPLHGTKTKKVFYEDILIMPLLIFKGFKKSDFAIIVSQVENIITNIINTKSTKFSNYSDHYVKNGEFSLPKGTIDHLTYKGSSYVIDFTYKLFKKNGSYYFGYNTTNKKIISFNSSSYDYQEYSLCNKIFPIINNNEYKTNLVDRINRIFLDREIITLYND